MTQPKARGAVGQKRVTINLPSELAKFVRQQAREQAVTVSQFFRTLARAERGRVTGQ